MRLVEARARLVAGDFAAAATAACGLRFGPADGVDLSDYARFYCGAALLHADLPAQAVAPLSEARASAGPLRARAAALLADARLAAGDAAGAARDAEALVSGHPDAEAELLLVAARAHRLLGERDAAGGALLELWLLHPEHPAARAAIAEVRELRRAGAKIRHATDGERLARARRLSAAGLPHRVLVAARRLAKRTTERPIALDALLLAADALGALGRRADAALPLQTAWDARDPERSAKAGVLLARLAARRGERAKALALLDDVQRRYPTRPQASEAGLLGAALAREGGDATGALERWAAVARRWRGGAGDEARWARAWTLRTLGRASEAAVELAKLSTESLDPAWRAQAEYWRATLVPAQRETALRAAAAADPTGYYGALAAEALSPVATGDAPGTLARPPPLATATPPSLARADALAGLGLAAEAVAEADFAIAGTHDEPALLAAVGIYERAGRFDKPLRLVTGPLANAARRDPALAARAYPLAYADVLGPATRRSGLDPFFLLALMRRESAFRPDVRSPADARGVLQLLPATATRISAVLGTAPPDPAELAAPATSIELAAWYVSELLSRFHGDLALAAAAYNAGPRVVAGWAAAGGPRDEWVEGIPYRETRGYVKAVLGAYATYRRLSGGGAPALEGTVVAAGDGIDF